MAHVRFSLGGEADIASGDELAAGFKGVSEQIGGLAANLTLPLHRKLCVAGPILADGTLTLTYGKPSSGRLWRVTQASIFKSALDGTLGSGAIPTLCIGDAESLSFTPLSAVFTVSTAGAGLALTVLANRDQFIVHDDEELFWHVTAGASGTQLAATAQVWDYTQSAMEPAGI